MDTVKVKRGSGTLDTLMRKAKQEGKNVLLIDGERIASECLVPSTVFDKEGKATQKEPSLKQALSQPQTLVFLLNMSRSYAVIREAVETLTKDMTSDSSVVSVIYE